MSDTRVAVDVGGGRIIEAEVPHPADLAVLVAEALRAHGHPVLAAMVETSFGTPEDGRRG